MATEINLNFPTIDNTQSIGIVTITALSISATTVTTGITINDAFDAKNNTEFIIVSNTAESAKIMTIEAGDAYPNKMLGDLAVTLGESSTNAIQIQDPSRFENKDGSMGLVLATGFTGSIYTIAKLAGLKPVS